MSIYIPFSGATASIINNLNNVKEFVTIESENVLKAVSNNEIALPTTLNELDKETVDIVNLTVDAALSLNISFGSTDNKVSRSVFIQEYKKYKEIVKDNETLHYGIGIRWILNIRKINSSADITSLPMVAASAQFNSLSASVRFEVVGLSSQEITNLLPTNAELNADSYVELKNAFEKIKSKIWNEATRVSPTALGVQGTIKSEDYKVIKDSVPVVYALKNIKSKNTLNKALSSISNKPQSIKEIVTSVYEEITKKSDINYTPNNSDKEKTIDFLNGLI